MSELSAYLKYDTASQDETSRLLMMITNVRHAISYFDHINCCHDLCRVLPLDFNFFNLSIYSPLSVVGLRRKRCPVTLTVTAWVQFMPSQTHESAFVSLSRAV